MSNVNPWLLLLIGFLLGFIVEWLIELWYWRRQRMATQFELQRLRDKMHVQNAELTAAQAHLESMQQATNTEQKASPSVPAAAPPPPVTATPPQPDLAPAPASISPPDSPQPPLPGLDTDATPPSRPVVIDDLTRIKGIGARFAAILGEAGINSFRQLADTTPDALQAIVQAPEWRKVDYSAWIQQARELADAPAPISTGDDLTELDGIGPAYATRLQDAGIDSFAALAASDAATLGAIIQAPAWRQPDYGAWIAQAQARVQS